MIGSFKEEGIVCIDMVSYAIDGLGERQGVKLGELEDMDFVKSEESCYILTDAGRIARL